MIFVPHTLCFITLSPSLGPPHPSSGPQTRKANFYNLLTFLFQIYILICRIGTRLATSQLLIRALLARLCVPSAKGVGVWVVPGLWGSCLVDSAILLDTVSLVFPTAFYLFYWSAKCFFSSLNNSLWLIPGFCFSHFEQVRWTPSHPKLDFDVETVDARLTPGGCMKSLLPT